jgi:uncharacterized membrane protein
MKQEQKRFQIGKFSDLEKKWRMTIGIVIVISVVMVLLSGAFVTIFQVPADAVMELASIGRFLQAIGLLVIIWIFMQIITYFFNRESWRILKALEKDVNSIDKRLSSLDEKIDSLKSKK